MVNSHGFMRCSASQADEKAGCGSDSGIQGISPPFAGRKKKAACEAALLFRLLFHLPGQKAGRCFHCFMFNFAERFLAR